MTVVDKDVADLFDGYNFVGLAQNRLEREWKPSIDAAAQERQRAQVVARQARAQRERKVKKEIGLTLLAGALMSVSLLALSLTVFRDRWEMLPLACCCTPLGSITVALLFWLGGRGAEAMADRPEVGMLGLKYRWWQSVRGSLPVDVDDPTGAECDFLRLLQERFGRGHFFLHSIQQRPGEDVDVVMVGPLGVWVFEVKYWKGMNRYKKGSWRREEIVWQHGKQVRRELPVDQPPDMQWQRAMGDVEETLRRRAPDLRLRLESGVQGGLVFTYPGAQFDINGLPVAWGDRQWWLARISQTQPVPNWQTVDSLEALDAILSRHQEITGTPSRSTKAYAQQLSHDAQQELARWARGNQP